MKIHIEVDDVGLIVEEPIPTPGISCEVVLRLAAVASCNGCKDPGDTALICAANKVTGSIGYSQKRGSYSPPTKDQHYGTVRAKNLEGGEEFEVARGEMVEIMSLCAVPEAERQALDVAMKPFRKSGFRAVAVATRSGQGAWKFCGVVPLVAMRIITKISEARTQFRYFPLWDWPLRILHWGWVLSVLGLATTGICIAEGWYLKRGDLTSGFQFGDVRFIHYALAWILVAIMTLRFSIFFFASNKYQTFRSLFPISKENWIDLYKTGLDYLLARSFDGPRYIGHNPLQQWTYTGIYALFTIMIVTGFALYALYEPTQWFYQWFMPLNDLIGIPYVRLVHLLGMWCFLVFAFIHVYLSILSGNVDRDGTISSMFSGGRWVRKGVRFHDE
ncbi:MAG: cytochrome b/b6 domain-containing protein [Akkermansia sp.]